MATTDNPSACTEAGDSSSVDEEHEVQLASRIEKLGTVCRESSMVGAALDTGSAVKERCKKKVCLLPSNKILDVFSCLYMCLDC